MWLTCFYNLYWEKQFCVIYSNSVSNDGSRSKTWKQVLFSSVWAYVDIGRYGNICKMEIQKSFIKWSPHFAHGRNTNAVNPHFLKLYETAKITQDNRVFELRIRIRIITLENRWLAHLLSLWYIHYIRDICTCISGRHIIWNWSRPYINFINLIFIKCSVSILYYLSRMN